MLTTMATKRKPPKPGTWAFRFWKLRTDNDLTQTEAAKRVCISQSQWNAFESGKRGTPTRPIRCLIRLWELGKLPKNLSDE